jgi:hypothetical protein
VRQEDGTRDAFEAVYQAIDRDGSKTIDLPEFQRYFRVGPVETGASGESVVLDEVSRALPRAVPLGAPRRLSPSVSPRCGAGRAADERATDGRGDQRIRPLARHGQGSPLLAHQRL